MTDQSTQPLTEDDLDDIRARAEKFQDRSLDNGAGAAYDSAADVPRLLGELERLHSWDGLMDLLDEHWPEDIFPTREDDAARDPGPRIVSLLRWVDRLRAENTALRAGLDQFRTLEDRIPDDSNGERMFGWDKGWNAARSDVRKLAALALGLDQNGEGQANG